MIPNFVASKPQTARASEVHYSEPVSGEPVSVMSGTPDIVEEAVEAAHAARRSFRMASSNARSELLRSIASNLAKREQQLVDITGPETGLPEARIRGELARTTGQLQLFADLVEKGEYLDARSEPADPDRKPAPRPGLTSVMRPVGPVAVFGASNFPLAFSVVGGDTASALAAGCPVVFKGHYGHPETSRIVAEAISDAVTASQLPGGVFSMVNDGGQGANGARVGASLVTHDYITAVGFTGSYAGGRALFDLCASRPRPIPFFGELGSINPVFVLPSAAKDDTVKIAKDWAASLCLGLGQFCTNPGVIFVPQANAEVFEEAARDALPTGGPMLTARVASAYNASLSAVLSQLGAVSANDASGGNPRSAEPQIARIRSSTWTSTPMLHEEVFGPFGLIVEYADIEELPQLADNLAGQLTATLFFRDQDVEVARGLLPILEEKAGRILANGWPTGVEVSSAMVHGGPYPASTNFGHTSVGTMAIRRWLRPVCFQNMPDDLIPRVFDA